MPSSAPSRSQRCTVPSPQSRGLSTASSTEWTAAKKKQPVRPFPGRPSGTAVPRCQGYCRFRSQAGTASPRPWKSTRSRSCALRQRTERSPWRGCTPDTYPQKTEGPGDRLNATHAKREERKRRRRVCGKAKQHLPDLLLNIALRIVEELGDPYTAKPALSHVPSPMQISGTSDATTDRHDPAPLRAVGWRPSGHAAMNYKPFSGKPPPAVPAWRCRAAPGWCGRQAVGHGLGSECMRPRRSLKPCAGHSTCPK